MNNFKIKNKQWVNYTKYQLFMQSKHNISISAILTDIIDLIVDNYLRKYNWSHFKSYKSFVLQKEAYLHSKEYTIDRLHLKYSFIWLLC